MITRKMVLKAIGNAHLDMELADGYVYFIYDDVATNRYDTHSVYGCNKLNHMELEQWVSIGREFVTKMEAA